MTVGLPFRPWAYDTMLTWLSEHQIPLWIPLPDMDTDDLVTTLQAYPDLVSMIVGGHYMHALLVRPLLMALPNAHWELSRYEPMGEVEALCHEFGAHRFVYGSWYPRYAMGPILFYLHHASFSRTGSSEVVLSQICAGNLERILHR